MNTLSAHTMDDRRKPAVMHSKSDIRSHIEKLTDDILWTIFMTNTADPYFMAPYQHPDPTASLARPLETAPRPLETARLTSQVCSRWRNIALNSPSLWGRLIDFVSLDQASDTWRIEVLRRSGTSMLWISAENLSDEMDYFFEGLHLMHQFFFDLCNNHWERVEKISVALNYNVCTEVHLDPMKQPSPNLLSFKFLSYYANFRTSTIPSPIFSSYAPKLLHFQAGGIGCVPRMDWMMNLRELGLDYLYNVNEVLDILQHMKLLESLSLIGHVGFETRNRPSHIVHLPRLCRLEVQNCLEYIRYIKPAPGCSFRLIEDKNSAKLKVLESCQNEIADMLQEYNMHNIPKFMGLYCTDLQFCLTNFPRERRRYFDRSECRQLEDRQFEIIVSLYDNNKRHQINSDIISLLFNTAALPNYSSVTELSLDFSLILAQLFSAFTKFIATFTSVECLHSNYKGLRKLLVDDVVRMHLFPNLRMFNLTNAISGHHRPDCMKRFLISRIEMGAPISTIDITRIENNKDMQLNVDSLDQFEGMLVVYSKDGIIKEYVCGSGDPEFRTFLNMKLV